LHCQEAGWSEQGPWRISRRLSPHRERDRRRRRASSRGASLHCSGHRCQRACGQRECAARQGSESFRVLACCLRGSLEDWVSIDSKDDAKQATPTGGRAAMPESTNVEVNMIQYEKKLDNTRARRERQRAGQGTPWPKRVGQKELRALDGEAARTSIMCEP